MSASEIVKKETTDSFVNVALAAMPRPVLGLLGTLFGVVIFLIFGGFQSYINRIASAYASRIERAVSTLEEVTAKISVTDANVKALDKRVESIDDRLKAVEQVVDAHVNRKK